MYEYVRIFSVVCTGTIGVGILIGVLAFSGCNTNFALIILLLTITVQGAHSAGPLSASIDLAPNFSGKVRFYSPLEDVDNDLEVSIIFFSLLKAF